MYEDKGTGPGDLRQLVLHGETAGGWRVDKASLLSAALLICFAYWVSKCAFLEREGSAGFLFLNF